MWALNIFEGRKKKRKWMWQSLSHVRLFLAWILQARILEWVAGPFSRGSSQPRDWTQGGFFTSWATRDAQEYWSGYPIPSPADLPNPGIEPGSPALQSDYLSTELSGKPLDEEPHKSLSRINSWHCSPNLEGLQAVWLDYEFYVSYILLELMISRTTF